MEKKTKSWKFFSWNTLFLVLAVCVIQTGIWIGTHGVPLIGLPKVSEVSRVTVIHAELGEVEVTDPQEIKMLVNAANLLNYRFSGSKEGEPQITVIYHCSNGKDLQIAANATTMWWQGQSHPVKETDSFILIVQGYYFSQP